MLVPLSPDVAGFNDELPACDEEELELGLVGLLVVLELPVAGFCELEPLPVVVPAGLVVGVSFPVEPVVPVVVPAGLVVFDGFDGITVVGLLVVPEVVGVVPPAVVAVGVVV